MALGEPILIGREQGDHWPRHWHVILWMSAVWNSCLAVWQQACCQWWWHHCGSHCHRRCRSDKARKTCGRAQYCQLEFNCGRQQCKCQVGLRFEILWYLIVFQGLGVELHGLPVLWGVLVSVEVSKSIPAKLYEIPDTQLEASCINNIDIIHMILAPSPPFHNLAWTCIGSHVAQTAADIHWHCQCCQWGQSGY